MGEILIFLSKIPVGVWGAIIGAVASLLAQFILFRFRLFMSAKRFRRDMANLIRHVEASLNSLEIDSSRPKYLIVARIRFCKFLDGISSLDDLDWLTRRRDSDRILPALLAIRNSDIFLEEVASRIEHMTDAQLQEAIEDAKLNLQFLKKTVSRLGYAESIDDQLFTKHFARETLKEMSRNSDGSKATPNSDT